MAERLRIEVAFDGGQAFSTLAAAAEVDKLERAVGGADVVTLEGDDGRYVVAMARVAYVKRHARESRVGFGG